jgi:hypothetical protein
MNKTQIINEITIYKKNITQYYFDGCTIPDSLMKYLRINTYYMKNCFNIRLELFNIKKQKTNGLLYGVCHETGDKMKVFKTEYDYIFCAPSICSILLCLFRFNNCKIYLFPYLSRTKVKYSCKQLRNIIEDLKDKFNKIDIEFDLSFMEDYTGGFEKLFTYLYIVIKNINNCKALCVLEELYNEQTTSLFISSQIRDIDMSLCNIANQDITIECKNKYNLPIVHQIIDRIDSIYFNLYDLLLGV